MINFVNYGLLSTQLECSQCRIIVICLQKLQIAVFIITTVVTVRRSFLGTGLACTAHHLAWLSRACHQLFASTLQHIYSTIVLAHSDVAVFSGDHNYMLYVVSAKISHLSLLFRDLSQRLPSRDWISRWARLILSFSHAFRLQRVRIIVATHITVPAKLFKIGLEHHLDFDFILNARKKFV